MKIVVMEANTLGSDVDFSIFNRFGEVVCYPLTSPEENAKRIEDADIIIANKIQMNEELLKDAKNLKLICITATGTNIVDFEYTNSRGIAVANVKGYSTMSVVQHTFALFFFLYEKMHYYDTFVKSEEYVRSDVFSHFSMKFNELAGKTWGVVGLGDIGSKVAEIAEAFGCKVVYYSTSGKNNNDRFKRVSMEELLANSDVISIHAPLNSDTQGLFGEKEFAAMKKTAILLNLGRGPIVEEEALANALESGEIAGAGLDVLCKEPMSADNPLVRIKDSGKLVITPHIAWATVEARQRCAEEVALNIESFLSGGDRNIVRG